MNIRIVTFLMMLLPLPSFAQGFAGLGATDNGFALPDPATRFSFPEDHGAHTEFRIEWWYITANLIGEDGQAYGIQWTLFRNALAPTGADADQAWMAHAAVSTPQGHLVAERLARGGIGQAGVTAHPFRAYIDEWVIEGLSPSDIRLFAQGTDFAYELSLESDQPFVPQGAEGFSVKSDAGQASHYYSQPFYDVKGTLSLPSGEIAVNGKGWLDREWSSAPLAPDQTGWDWISLHLDTSEKLMGYRLRDTSGQNYTVGTWIAPDGSPSPLEPGALTMTPLRTVVVSGRDVPVVWQVSLPARNLEIRVEALYHDSWMNTLVPYWEGPVRFDGTHTGEGYLEMSGYE